MVLRPSGAGRPRPALRAFVALTPLLGSMAVPVVVPLTMKHAGIATGLALALLLSTVWFVLMLRTSEMPQPEGGDHP